MYLLKRSEQLYQAISDDGASNKAQKLLGLSDVVVNAKTHMLRLHSRINQTAMNCRGTIAGFRRRPTYAVGTAFVCSTPRRSGERVSHPQGAKLKP